MITTYCAVLVLLIVAYLLGSIPSAVWIGRRYYGVDIREHGSKNAGATNMLRVLGYRAALPVFIIDFLKGFVAVSLMALLESRTDITAAWLINCKIFAVAFAVLGHIFPVFASFKGGKGVSTLVGSITGIEPQLALLCFVIWLVVFLFTHYVSLSSIIAGCCFPIFVAIFSFFVYREDGSWSLLFLLFSVVVALLLVWTHRTNIKRLREGTEPRTYIRKNR